MAFLTICSGCQIVTLHDEELYFPIGSSDGAIREHTISAGQEILSSSAWAGILDKDPYVCVSRTTYGSMKADIETLCNASPSACTQDTTTQMRNFFLKVDTTFSTTKKK